MRDADGLALSSRNAYLSTSQRAAALWLVRALWVTVLEFSRGRKSGARLARVAVEVIRSEPGVQLEYAAWVDPVSFEPLEEAGDASRLILAARVGGVRLLDTAVVGSRPPEENG